MKVDILAFAAHPDDVELSCSGTLLKEIYSGKKVAIVDLTEGELGSRGSVETRYREAELSASILGLSARENLNIGDGTFENNHQNRLKIIAAIRKYQPDLVLANAPKDRHPDHGRASSLVSEAFFYAGLRRIETFENGVCQKEWRPNLLLHYIQDQYLEPDFVVDVSDFWEKRMESVKAYKTQFYDPESKEPNTPISSAEFLDFLEARGASFGRPIGVKYAEGFIKSRIPGVNYLTDLI